MRVLPRNAPAMNQSIEEEEVTAQRDAAVSLFKGLQQRVCLAFASNSKYDNLTAFCVPLISFFALLCLQQLLFLVCCTREGLAAAATRSVSTPLLGRRVTSHSMCRQSFALICGVELLLCGVCIATFRYKYNPTGVARHTPIFLQEEYYLVLVEHTQPTHGV